MGARDRILPIDCGPGDGVGNRRLRVAEEREGVWGKGVDTSAGHADSPPQLGSGETASLTTPTLRFRQTEQRHCIPATGVRPAARTAGFPPKIEDFTRAAAP